jgi:ketosteroid isomerase-like protein
LLEAWACAVQARDLDRIVEHHARDILMFDVPTVQLEGMEAYKESWREMFPWLGEQGRFELSDMRIRAGEDVAFVSAISTVPGPSS